MQKIFLKIAPYFIVLIVFIVATSLLVWDFKISERNINISTFLIQEKGKSILQTIESNIIASQIDTKEKMDDLILNYALQDDVEFIALANGKGIVLVSNNSNIIGKILPITPALADAYSYHACINPDFPFTSAQLKDSQYIIVPRPLFPPRRHFDAMHSRHKRDKIMHCQRELMRNFTVDNTQLFLVVGFKTEEILEAQLRDDKKTMLHVVAFSFLILMSLLSFVLLKKYQKSYQLIEASKVYFDGLMKTIPLGIITLNKENRIVTCNPVTEEMLGSKNLIGKNICDFIPSVAYLNFDVPIVNAMVKTMHNPDNSLELNSFIITVDNEKNGIGIILRDLKEIQKLQEELNRKDRLASVGQLAAGIAHEIRNPLSTIKGFARIFEENAREGSEEKTLAQIMNQEICRVDKVIADLLEFSKPNTLTKSIVSLQKVIEQVQNSLIIQSKENQVTFSNEISGQEVSLDFDKMIQVFHNLYLNAIEAMTKNSPDKEKRITTKAWQEQDKCIISIHDTGHGIAQNKISHLFTPYFTTKAKGTGLGLVIVQKIIEAHKGTVKVESQENAGTTFFITLPLNAER